MAKLGRKFEEAVFAFVKALDPSAEVLFDHSVPDRDTREPRQCDVWINAKFRGHWPLSILVSCKDHRKSGRKLHSGDIGTFCDEIRSTGASTGVIYCNTGFCKPALKKAKANGIACCRLYERESPDIPEAIWLSHFACAATIRLGLNIYSTDIAFNTWNDIFDLKIIYKDKHETVLDIISQVFAAGEKKVASKMKKPNIFPSDWQTVITFKVGGIRAEFKILIVGRWKRYRARIEAILLDGSYCISDQSFSGSLTGPLIHLQGVHPGEGWTEIGNTETVSSENTLTAILTEGDTKTSLRVGYGRKILDLRNRRGLCQKDPRIKSNLEIIA